jgi:hypothetical protein
LKSSGLMPPSDSRKIEEESMKHCFVLFLLYRGEVEKFLLKAETVAEAFKEADTYQMHGEWEFWKLERMQA